MTKLTLFILILLPLANISAQLNPVTWTYDAVKINDQEYDLRMTAKCEGGWYIYSQYLESEDGPIATSFSFEPNANLSLVGKITESGHKKEGFDEMFGMNIIKFSDEVVFTQRIRILADTPSLGGVVTYMTCNNEKCLPPKDVSFSILLP